MVRSETAKVVGSASPQVCNEEVSCLLQYCKDPVGGYYYQVGTYWTLQFGRTTYGPARSPFPASPACGIHFVEGCFAARAAMQLKLHTSSALCWFLITLLGGNGTLRRVKKLADMAPKTKHL